MLYIVSFVILCSSVLVLLKRFRNKPNKSTNRTLDDGFLVELNIISFSLELSNKAKLGEYPISEIMERLSLLNGNGTITIYELKKIKGLVLDFISPQHPYYNHIFSIDESKKILSYSHDVAVALKIRNDSLLESSIKFKDIVYKKLKELHNHRIIEVTPNEISIWLANMIWDECVKYLSAS